jgi:hypothetical protein
MLDQSLYSECFLERVQQLFEVEFKKANQAVAIFPCHDLNQINDRVFLQTDQHILLHYPFNMNLHLPPEKSSPLSLTQNNTTPPSPLLPAVPHKKDRTIKECDAPDAPAGIDPHTAT